MTADFRRTGRGVVMVEDFMQFVQKIKHKTGIDLSEYKEAQMKRRLTSLRDKRGYKLFEDYFDALISTPDLYNEFLDKMTINVSEFYRNPGRWQVLEEKIIPRLMQDSRRLKVWSAACSTGEEPYSLVMLLSNFLPLAQIQVKATDIDQKALQTAQEGIYNERSLHDVPKPLVQQFFRQEGEKYTISGDIKKRVSFAQQNLLADSYGEGYDLIVCRNVLIYFTEEAKEKLYHKFAAALRPGGVLFVGSTEQIFRPQHYALEPEDTFFYRKM